MHEIQMLGLLEHDVLSSIEVPFLPDHSDPFSTPSLEGFTYDTRFSYTKREADKFDMDIFLLNRDHRATNTNRNSIASSGSGTIVAAPYMSAVEKRSMIPHRNSIMSTKSARSVIPPIEESPRRIIRDLPEESSEPQNKLGLGTSPSQSSVRSVQSSQSSSTTSSNAQHKGSRNKSSSRGSLTSKFTSSWLFNPFRSGLSEPQTSSISASAAPIRVSAVTPTTVVSSVTTTPKPVSIKTPTRRRSSRSSAFTFDEDAVSVYRASHTRHSPMNTPPRDEPAFGKRRSGAAINTLNLPSASSSTNCRPNPSRPKSSVAHEQAALARRWQHLFPQLSYKHEIKWKAMVTPSCLPLTVEYFPSTSELESSYDLSSYDFVVHPPEMRSFLVNPPVVNGNADDVRRAWALVVMRGMAAVRLAQGFQFVVKPSQTAAKVPLSHSKSFIVEDDMTPKPSGAADVLRSTVDPVYLSMSNEIHRISYARDSIHVRRYVRRMPPTKPFKYQCLIWPKLGVGYTELETSFVSRGLENYGWNR
jgi:hypothetical protein